MQHDGARCGHRLIKILVGWDRTIRQFAQVVRHGNREGGLQFALEDGEIRRLRGYACCAGLAMVLLPLIGSFSRRSWSTIPRYSVANATIRKAD